MLHIAYVVDCSLLCYFREWTLASSLCKIHFFRIHRVSIVSFISLFFFTCPNFDMFLELWYVPSGKTCRALKYYSTTNCLIVQHLSFLIGCGNTGVLCRNDLKQYQSIYWNKTGFCFYSRISNLLKSRIYWILSHVLHHWIFLRVA